MNNVFTAKLLQNLNNKKGNKGFTLIELLVVVIIIGVLAAVALPNLLGQVGKARESEAKTALGALNRAQQGHHLEARKFYTATGADDAAKWNNTMAALGIVPGTEFYTFANTTAADNEASFTADGDDPANDGVRDFASGANYGGGAFTTTMCVANTKDASGGTASVTMTAGGGACTGGNLIK